MVKGLMYLPQEGMMDEQGLLVKVEKVQETYYQCVQIPEGRL